MLSEIEAFMTAHQLADVALVANAGMASEAQPEEIETAGLSFNNPRRGDPRPAHLHHVAHRAWTPWRRLCLRTPALSEVGEQRFRVISFGRSGRALRQNSRNGKGSLRSTFRADPCRPGEPGVATRVPDPRR